MIFRCDKVSLAKKFISRSLFKSEYLFQKQKRWKGKLFTILVSHYFLIRKTHELKKKKQNGLLDVTIRAYDGWEVCELEKYNKKDFRISCDNGIGVGKNKREPKIEKLRKIYKW